MKEKKKIWSIYTRLFHIMLIVGVVISYITIDKENQLISHVLIGYVIALLTLFRIIWGFIDVKCSRHEDLARKVSKMSIYFKDYFKKNREEFMGHNPASSLYVLLIMIVLAFVTISGSLLYGIQENSGIFSSLNKDYSHWMLFIESFHKLSTTTLLVLTVLHILGVIFNLFFNGTEVILSMLTGKRRGTDFDVVLSKKQQVFGLLWISSVIALAVYFYNSPDNIFTEDKTVEIDFRSESYETASRCGSCHMIYPAYLLPKQAWSNMMGDLENHFGKDASLPDEETQMIREYLMNNASEHSTKEAAIKVLDRMKEKTPVAITQTNYWKEKHKDITKEQFAADYGIKSDCRTCHTTIRDGLIQDKKIKFKY